MISPVVRCAHAGAVTATSTNRHMPSLSTPRRMSGPSLKSASTVCDSKNVMLANLTRRVNECQDEFGLHVDNLTFFVLNERRSAPVVAVRFTVPQEALRC